MAIQFLLPNDLKCIAGLFCEKNPRITAYECAEGYNSYIIHLQDQRKMDAFL
jgi:hypothetical protein